DTFGYTVGTATGGINVLTALGCAGFIVPPLDPGCRADPDNDMDWHIHCPSGALCPDLHVAGSSTALLKTPAKGQLALSGPNSLHYGRHTDALTRVGDTTAFRELAAYTTNPINLTPLPVAGDLLFSFYHIADMMDSSCGGRSGGCTNMPAGTAVDYGDVQIRSDLNADPLIDDWGPWDKLVPFVNVYDHIPIIWSWYGPTTTYCNLTPTDTGTAAPAPRGVHETMCHPLGVWSHCGNAWGTDTTWGCPGPGRQGELAPSPGTGALWVQSQFQLANFLGARVQIRWIAEGWEFALNNTTQDYVGYTSWATSMHDDGWWVDNIEVTGVVESQASPVADIDPPATPTCPSIAGANCNESLGDQGYVVSLPIPTDTNGDGVFESGETLLFNASKTTNPGLCVNGATEFKFLKNGAIARDYAANPYYKDAPTSDATYQVLVRCSSDPSCTTATGASQAVQIYNGDGQEIALTVTHDRTTGITTLSWPARQQPAPLTGYDAFRGSVLTAATPPAPDINLTTLTTLRCDYGVGAAVPSTVSYPIPATDPQPAVGAAQYFLVGHSSTVAGAKDALGRSRLVSASGVVTTPIRIAPLSCP
ncbi:MAG TPA: hypothetical protein VFT43_08275, partial [Candidatus Polarisedimenticolia bacterium]|nr:hypothetical protein [Candidatus Polarisedimenticolia bacterium]